MWASSMTYTLNRLFTGAKKARSRRSRASSTPPWLAASISMTSIEPGPSGASETQEVQTPHGVDVGPARRSASGGGSAPGASCRSPAARWNRRRGWRRGLLAVQRAGEDPRRGRLAAAARPAEQVGVVDPAAVDGVDQRGGDVLLPDHLGEGRRAVLPVERQSHAEQVTCRGRRTLGPRAVRWMVTPGSRSGTAARSEWTRRGGPEGPPTGTWAAAPRARGTAPGRGVAR